MGVFNGAQSANQIVGNEMIYWTDAFKRSEKFVNLIWSVPYTLFAFRRFIWQYQKGERVPIPHLFTNGEYYGMSVLGRSINVHKENVSARWLYNHYLLFERGIMKYREWQLGDRITKQEILHYLETAAVVRDMLSDRYIKKANKLLKDYKYPQIGG